MFRGGAAAAAKECRAHRFALGKDVAKFFRRHRVVGKAVVPDDRVTGVGLAHKGTFHIPA